MSTRTKLTSLPTMQPVDTQGVSWCYQLPKNTVSHSLPHHTKHPQRATRLDATRATMPAGLRVLLPDERRKVRNMCFPRDI